jgi:transposase
MEEVAAKAGVSRATIGTWTKAFRSGGIKGVLATTLEKCGRKPRLESAVQQSLREQLAVGRFKRAQEAQRWLKERHGVELDLPAMYYWLGKVGGVLKVPRKTHLRKDAAATEAFKGELGERLFALGLPKRAKVRVWMVDEHRYGLISVLRKVWTLRGHKLQPPIKPSISGAISMRPWRSLGKAPASSSSARR